MASKIAEFFGEIGFRVNERGLKQFQGQMKRLQTDFEGVSRKTASTSQQSSDFFKRIKQDYSRVRPSLAKMRQDYKEVGKQLKLNNISASEAAEARQRLVERIGQVEKQKEVAHQRAIKETERVQSRAQKNVSARLSQISKKYDTQNHKLRQVRESYRLVNSEFRRGNISIETRQRQLKSLIAEYRRLQMAQAATSRAGVGPYAGGKDPRQRGTHGFISFLHSDAVLMSAAGGLLASRSISANQELVGAQQGLSAALGDPEKGAKEFEYLIETSQRLGVSLSSTSDSYKSFLASTQGTALQGEQTREIFESVASYGKVLNLGAADMQGVFLAITQMVSKGVVQTQELRDQFGERLPGAMQAAARAMGKTDKEFQKLLASGDLTAEDLLPKLSKELLKMAKSGGQLEAAMNNTNSAINRAGTNILLANKKFNESGFDKSVRNLLNLFSDSIMRADPLFEVLGRMSEYLLRPVEAGLELFGALSEVLGEFGISVFDAKNSTKSLLLVMGLLFRWSRRMLAVFYLIPAAVSGVSEIIKGENLTWQEWAVTLAGVAASLGIIAGALGKMKKLGSVLGLLGAGEVVDGKGGKDANKNRSAGGKSGWLGRGLGFLGKAPITTVLAAKELAPRMRTDDSDAPWWNFSKRWEDISRTLGATSEDHPSFLEKGNLAPMLNKQGGIGAGELPFGNVHIDRIDINVESTDPIAVGEEVERKLNTTFAETLMQQPVTER